MKTRQTAETGIDIRQRCLGETIVMETENGILELIVLAPAQRLVRVAGTDSRLHRPTVGRLECAVSAINPEDTREAWIGPARYLVIAFRNAVFETSAVLSATIRGRGWHFDVF